MTREKSCKTGIPSYNELVNYARSTGLDNNADSLQSCAPSTSKTMDIGMDSDSFPRSKINPSEVVEVIQYFDDPPNKNELLLRLKKVEEEKQQFAAANLKLSIKIQQLEQENCQLKDKCQTERIAYDALQLVFTPGQVKKLMSPHITRVNWTAEDISSAIALKAVSGKAYDYLRIVKKIPLPCVQTLRNWSANFNVQPGLLEDVLQIMQSKGKTLSVINKLTVLLFDVYISNKVDLDRRLQKIVGPHKTCQFVMARALFGNWRQPIFFNYDQPMTKEILLDIIKHLQEADYTVVAVTSDMGPTNMRLWKSMNIGVEIQNNRNPQLIGQCEEKKCYFSHPMDQTMKIFVFADVPHLMKLARNI